MTARREARRLNDAAARTSRRRSWKVLVRDVGPMFSFADEKAARERAERLVSGEEFTVGHSLVGCYAEVVVWNTAGEIFTRTWCGARGPGLQAGEG